MAWVMDGIGGHQSCKICEIKKPKSVRERKCPRRIFVRLGHTGWLSTFKVSDMKICPSRTLRARTLYRRIRYSDPPCHGMGHGWDRRTSILQNLRNKIAKKCPRTKVSEKNICPSRTQGVVINFQSVRHENLSIDEYVIMALRKPDFVKIIIKRKSFFLIIYNYKKEPRRHANMQIAIPFRPACCPTTLCSL